MVRRAALLLLATALGACAEERGDGPRDDPFAADPLLARALNDPLMADPDLAYRNEANAAVTIPAGHALPPFARTDEAALAAREAARLELLEGGRVPDLPDAAPDAAPERALGAGPAGLGEARTAADMLAAAGAPERCAEGLEEGFAFAADLPAAARLMPHAMVQQAAGGERAGGERAGGRASPCAARIVRYLTPAAGEDVLHYHFVRAGRAGLSPRLRDAPERLLVGQGDRERLVLAVRKGPGGMTAVDLVWWRP
ncbi:hypothetical protein [Erythrobacter sp.]|jgi:hypothetical protein|uniref:hypothetical protein n=1 Tax=Erythrobacter sp. TaxID=1042 RepID=UPI002EC25B3A|nr:hypothetical protein [Erythrobacter sp.]